MTGIALPLYDLPAAILDTPDVRTRIHIREGREEVQFHWWQTPAVLPVRFCGGVRLVRWGSRQRAGTPLPYGGWVAEDGCIRPETTAEKGGTGASEGCRRTDLLPGRGRPASISDRGRSDRGRSDRGRSDRGWRLRRHAAAGRRVAPLGHQARLQAGRREQVGGVVE